MVPPSDYGPDRKGVKYSGVFTDIDSCLRGPAKTQFQQIEDELKSTIYDSYWNKPLGKSRDQTPGLPKAMNIECTTFGKPNLRKFTLGEVVFPLKTPGQVLYEDKAHHNMYRFSHQDYFPGERIDRR